MKSRKRLLHRSRNRAALALALTSLLGGGAANAIQFETGNPDLSIRWDNTIRYNLGVRVESRDPAISENPNSDEGDHVFGTGDLVANRIDLLSEFDLVYKEKIGFRVSAAGWYDAAYDKRVRQSPALEAAGHETSYPGGRYSGETEDYYLGPYGEILDAFAFFTFNAGSVPVSIRAGRHTVYWGESLFTPLLGVSYSQSGLDLRKAQATPGVEAKELFLPLAQISGTAQITDDLSVAAQYFFEYEHARLPEGGTYLGSTDFILDGPGQFPLAPGLNIPRLPALEGDDRGSWGINARYRSTLLDGTLGFYYRRFDEVMPWVQIAPDASFYRGVFARDSELYGLSLSKSVLTASVGAELVYRRNTGFNSANVDPFDDEGARGDAYIGIVNAVYYIGSTSLFDSATLLGEFTAVHWDKVRSHDELFNAEGFGGCVGDRDTGCATKTATAVSLSFSPIWNQVLPSGDLTFPISYSRGLSGNGAVPGGGNKNAGNYSFGFSLLYANRYQIDLKYTDYFGSVYNGGGLRDRGWVGLTFKTAF